MSRHSAKRCRLLTRRRRGPRLRTIAYLGFAMFVAVLMLEHQPTDSTEELAAQPTAGGSRAPGSATDSVIGSACADLVAKMPMRDRLAQRLMVGVDPSAPAAARDIALNTHVGGMFIGGNATTILQKPALSAIQSATSVPVAIAVDDEGGRVQRIDTLHGSMPSAREMGKMPVEDVRRIAEERGRQLKAIGITVDFAPVLDVGSQPDDAVIGDRSFSPDPQVVVSRAGAFAAGLRDAGVIPVFKHFPGHGRAIGDSHKGLVTTPPLDSLRAMDLLPYEQLLGQGGAVVMVGHLDVPGLTDGVPATLSPRAYQLLRKEFAFSGVTITDDLGAMRAVSDRYGIVDAVAVALESGADIALWTSTQQLDEVLTHLVAESDTGRLPVADTDAAVTRILEMKGLCHA